MALKYKSGFLAEFRKAIQVPIKFIHVTRDPFDNIATLLLRYKKSREAVRAEGAKVRRVIKVARSRSFSRHTNLLLSHSLVGPDMHIVRQSVWSLKPVRHLAILYADRCIKSGISGID